MGTSDLLWVKLVNVRYWPGSGRTFPVPEDSGQGPESRSDVIEEESGESFKSFSMAANILKVRLIGGTSRRSHLHP